MMSLAELHPELLKEVDIDPQERWMTPVVNKVAMGHRPQGAADHVVIRDDTLRSGVNTPGVYVKNDVKMKVRSEEHTSELQSLMRISYAVFCLKKKNKHNITFQSI